MQPLEACLAPALSYFRSLADSWPDSRQSRPEGFCAWDPDATEGGPAGGASGLRGGAQTGAEARGRPFESWLGVFPARATRAGREVSSRSPQSGSDPGNGSLNSG